MEFLFEYGLFLAKAVTLVVAIGIILVLVVGIGASQRRSAQKGSIRVINYNETVEQMSDSLLAEALSEQQYKHLHKAKDKEEKTQAKDAKKTAKAAVKKSKTKSDAISKIEAAQDTKVATIQRPAQHFVLDFDGDIRASAVDTLRQEISAILAMAQPQDEVIVRLESGGGMVHAYGLAASQLQRIRDAQLSLTICVDMVAASGGYMMACLGQKIIAAPFAIIGSIGVVAQMPNFHRLLQKHDVDFDVYTAGEHKRSVTVLGKNTREGKDKLASDLTITHDLFKRWVSDQRPEVNISHVADGDVWYGQEALNLKLIDAIGTSDDYLQNLVKQNQSVLQVSYHVKKKIGERIGDMAATAVSVIAHRFSNALHKGSIER